jgi:DNA-binding response OmpR family regulator
MRVLVVDDNSELLELLERALEPDGHDVETATSAEQALEVLSRSSFEILVVDLGLPGMSGNELCRWVRERGSSPLILVLTAQSAVSSRVRSLDEGADDYLTKPFAVAELRARLRALSRRVFVNVRREPFVCGEVVLDFGKRRATVRGTEAPITAREWSILECLLSHQGQVVERRELLRRVWNATDDEALAASLEVLVGRIRRKLTPGIVRTVRGQGYLLDDGATDE